MKRFTILGYGVICYGIFFATFLALVGFVANAYIPKGIDAGTTGSLGSALLIDCALILLFAVQHTGMARPGFKRWLTRWIPQATERSTYVLLSSLVLIALMAAWQPLPGVIWSVGDPVGATLLWGLFGLGVGTVLYATFLIDHFDLFGLRQVFLSWRGTPYTHKTFVTPSLYKFIRHPLYVGWFLTFWMTPHMSAGHLLCAVGMSAYILVAIPFEERDLSEALGDVYRRYRARTPRFVPRLGGRSAAAVGAVKEVAR